MIITLAYLAAQYALLVAFFALVQRPLFIIYNRHARGATALTAAEIKAVYAHGWRSDSVVAALLTIVPALLCWLHLHCPCFRLLTALAVWNALAAIAVAATALSDTLLYPFWGTKVDSSALAYLKTPQGALASVTTRYILTASVALLALATILFAATTATAQALLNEENTTLPKPLIWHIVNGAAYISLLGILFLLIRGEGIRPNNPSMAYFSTDMFLNHCALNAMQNMLYSLSIGNEYRGKCRYYAADTCAAHFATLYPTTGTTQTHLLTTTRPHILLIIWESLGARFVAPLGGSNGITPQLNALATEGVWFTRCDSASFRTDRALPSLLCGIPAQPTASLIRHTRKLRHLPGLAAVLRSNGYDTWALHGGDCTIMNKRTFYLAAGHSRVVDQSTLCRSMRAAGAPQPATCKWGIHDGDVCRWLATELPQHNGTQPWMVTLQTLSSHEPFTVPYAARSNAIENAFAYTDACLGELIATLRATALWDNLLIIITGDHSIKEGATVPRDIFAHVPMLWVGGAVAAPRTVDTILSHSDLPATLLAQLHLPHSTFKYSRDIFADSYTYPFALHTYVNGFLFRDNTGATHYDNVAQRAISGADARREMTAKVILQTLYDDLAKL